MAKHYEIPCVLHVTVNEDSNTATGAIFSKAPSQKYAEGWENVFGKPAKETTDPKSVN